MRLRSFVGQVSFLALASAFPAILHNVSAEEYVALPMRDRALDDRDCWSICQSSYHGLDRPIESDRPLKLEPCRYQADEKSDLLTDRRRYRARPCIHHRRARQSNPW